MNTAGRGWRASSQSRSPAARSGGATTHKSRSVTPAGALAASGRAFALGSSAIIELQRTAGNQAVVELLAAQRAVDQKTALPQPDGNGAGGNEAGGNEGGELPTMLPPVGGATTQLRAAHRLARQLVDKFSKEKKQNWTPAQVETILAGIAFLVVQGGRARLYRFDGTAAGSFELKPEEPRWAPGWYLDSRGDMPRAVYETAAHAPALTYFELKEHEVASVSAWFTPETYERFTTTLSGTGSSLITAIVPDSPASRKTAKKKAKGEAPPDWAVDAVAGAKSRLGASLGTDVKLRRHHHGGRDKVRIRIGGLHGSIDLDPSESPVALAERIEKGVKELRGVKEATHGIVGGATTTGFVTPPPGPEHPSERPQGPEQEGTPGSGPAVGEGPRIEDGPAGAKLPRFQSHIKIYGNEQPGAFSTVLGATNQFGMVIDAPPDALVGTSKWTYNWELIKLDALTEWLHEGKVAGKAVERSQLTKGSGALGAAWREGGDIGGDLLNDLRIKATATSIATWPVRAAKAATLGLISTTVRSVGTVAKTFVSLATDKIDEQAVSFAEDGEFLLRCVATPNGVANQRESSVAVAPVRVATVHTRATEANDAELRQMAALREAMAKTPADSPQGRDLAEQMKQLEKEMRGNVEENASASLAANKADIDLLRQLEADNQAGTPDKDRLRAVRDLAIKIAKMGLTPGEFKKRNLAEQGHLQEQLESVAVFADKFGGKVYRPRMTLASAENGQVLPLTVELGEAPGSKDGARTWVLADISISSSRKPYSGSSSRKGWGGHAEAIQGALAEFAVNNGYGRGTIAGTTRFRVETRR